MSLDTATKQAIMTEYATVEGDTGSPEVQVAMLTRRISDLTAHLREHKHDHHTRRGLLLLVGRRKRLLKYLEKTDITRYRSLIARLDRTTGERPPGAPLRRRKTCDVHEPDPHCAAGPREWRPGPCPDRLHWRPVPLVGRPARSEEETLP